MARLSLTPPATLPVANQKHLSSNGDLVLRTHGPLKKNKAWRKHNRDNRGGKQPGVGSRNRAMEISTPFSRLGIGNSDDGRFSPTSFLAF
mmetsp:Transcript_26840/g.54948  ORF Transcript_26840/g.54948 Transcript_26840/m.54948 type:complete len:90 (-) Transcript_26840:94-363(-)